MIGVGTKVRFAVMPPWVTSLPEESQRVFRFCLGKTYCIGEIDAHGLYVLDVRADIDHRFRGYMNDIRLEAEYLIEVGQA